MAPDAQGQGFEAGVVERLKQLPGAVLEASVQRPHRLLARVRPEGLVEVCRLLSEAGFDHLSCVTCVDYETELEMVYLLWSFGERCLIELRSRISGTDPRMPSLAPLWAGAEFHEREAYDMFGVLFEGCPNLRRVLLPDEWTVHPLRKSFRVESVHDKRRRLEAERARARRAGAPPGAPTPPEPPARTQNSPAPGAERDAGEGGGGAPSREGREK